jgi:ABC-type multidrug transport system ATPase subunit
VTDAIETTGLTKRYGRRVVLSECTLSIPSGKVVGLVGPNGACKTTVLHLAVGLVEPSDGSVKVLGHTPGEIPEAFLDDQKEWLECSEVVETSDLRVLLQRSRLSSGFG